MFFFIVLIISVIVFEKFSEYKSVFFDSGNEISNEELITVIQSKKKTENAILIIPGYKENINKIDLIGLKDIGDIFLADIWKKQPTNVINVSNKIKMLYDRLFDKYEKVIIIGFSFGGVIGLDLCYSQKFDAVILVNTPYSLYGKHYKNPFFNLMLFFSGFIPHINKEIPKIGEFYEYKNGIRFFGSEISAQKFLLKKIRKKMKEKYIRIPFLIFQTENDRIVNPNSGKSYAKVIKTDFLCYNYIRNKDIRYSHRIWWNKEIFNEIKLKILNFLNRY